jgi:hypothetical protein
MLEGISSRWLGRFGVQIEAPSRQLLIDRELEVDVTKQSGATPSPERNGVEYGSVPSSIANLEEVRTATVARCWLIDVDQSSSPPHDRVNPAHILWYHASALLCAGADAERDQGFANTDKQSTL